MAELALPTKAKILNYNSDRSSPYRFEASSGTDVSELHWI